MDLEKIKKDSDTVLVERLKNKEEGAFAILIDRYKSPLFYMIYDIVNNTEDAEDLTMITFTKVFTAIDNYTPGFLFRTWLFSIARNASISFIRLKKNRIYGNYELNDYLDSGTPNPEQIIISNETVKILKYKIRHSNPLFREVIILRSMFGYKYREIEQYYGMSVSAGIQHTRRSRIFFRETLD